MTISLRFRFCYLLLPFFFISLCFPSSPFPNKLKNRSHFPLSLSHPLIPLFFRTTTKKWRNRSHWCWNLEKEDAIRGTRANSYALFNKIGWRFLASRFISALDMMRFARFQRNLIQYPDFDPSLPLALLESNVFLILLIWFRRGERLSDGFSSRWSRVLRIWGNLRQYRNFVICSLLFSFFLFVILEKESFWWILLKLGQSFGNRLLLLSISSF